MQRLEVSGAVRRIYRSLGFSVFVTTNQNTDEVTFHIQSNGTECKLKKMSSKFLDRKFIELHISVP